MPLAVRTYTCQVTWRDNGMHVWAWDGERPAPAGWLLRRVRPPGARSSSATSDLTRLTIDVHGAPRTSASSVRLDVASAVSWLGAHLGDTEHETSESAIWFGQVGVLAARLVNAGRFLPVVTTEHERLVARWVPALDTPLMAAVEALQRAAPGVCHDGEPGATRSIVDRFVDALCRHQLRESGWHPHAPGRDAANRARVDVFRALGTSDPGITTSHQRAVRCLGASLDRTRRRSSGEPVVLPRLRLQPPDEPADDWWVELQLVDDADGGRWCSAADVWSQTPLAVDLAGDVEHLVVLEGVLRDAVSLIVRHVPALDELGDEHQPHTVSLDLAATSAFLDEAPDQLREIDIDLIGPERLMQATVRVHAAARDAADAHDAGATRGRLGRRAVVDWTLSIDGGDGQHPLDEAAAARAEVAGASLLYSGGRWVRIDGEALRAAQRRLSTFRVSHSSLGGAALLRLAADAEDQLEVPVDLEGVAGWTRLLLEGLGDDRLEEAEEPDGFQGTLRHYQRRGLQWLRTLAGAGLGGCLADDMGLGKTATTLAHLVSRPGPHLVVCPLSVVRNWQSECARFTPSLRTLVHHGSLRTRGRDTLFALSDYDLVITTYGLLTRDIDTLGDVSWTTLVLDEAQAVKNASTQAARAVRAIPSHQTIALTGTPVENRLGDLWSILDAVNPGILGSRRNFRDRFAHPIERHSDAVAAFRLRTITEPLLLRRTKSDKQLVPDLPDKIEQVAWARLTPEQSILYRQVVDQLLVDADAEQGMRRRGIVLAAITRLKQICNHPAHALGDGSRLEGRSGKLDRFDELLGDILDGDDQMLVFTQFRAMGLLLRQHLLTRFGLAVPFLDGSVSAAGRMSMVDRFQAGGDRMLLISLRAGGTGLNLTAASHVLHYDRWWNPAVEDQATDRAWRIGQHRTVMVHKLVTEGTIEERIAAVIDEKRSVANAAVGRGETWMSELSTDELASLVRLDAPSTEGTP
ncbi:MAG: ATP-dependent helicase [Acidimicrobiia bacterium]|nr:ATP-dependent helicase [Acidimicrobiia bacterium]MDQ3390902.1 DEAD/DEAH box helicase [Actinomycetota bacterium]